MPKNQNQGFIQIIIIIVLLVIILSLLGVSLSSLFSNPILQQNFGYLGAWLANIWHNYLAAPFVYLWHLWVDIAWKPFLGLFGK